MKKIHRFFIVSLFIVDSINKLWTFLYMFKNYIINIMYMQLAIEAVALTSAFSHERPKAWWIVCQVGMDVKYCERGWIFCIIHHDQWHFKYRNENLWNGKTNFKWNKIDSWHEKSDETVYGHFSVIKNANIIHKTLQTRIHPDKLLGCKWIGKYLHRKHFNDIIKE